MSDNETPRLEPAWVQQYASTNPDTVDDFKLINSLNNAFAEIRAIASLLEFYGCQEDVSDFDAIYGAGLAIGNRIREIDQLLEIWHKGKHKPLKSIGGAS